MSSVMIVGETNPLSPDPEYALFPYPKNSSGSRLCKIFGLQSATYVKLRRHNLCIDGWDKHEAIRTARELRRGYKGVIVTLGRKVANAFEIYGQFFRVVEDQPPITYVLFPHPSGLSRIWNEPLSCRRARTIMRRIAPDVPWGEVVTECVECGHKRIDHTEYDGCIVPDEQVVTIRCGCAKFRSE